MQSPLQITFRHVDRSAALEARIRELAARLEKRSADIIHCHVTVEGPEGHAHQGGLYQVHIDLTLPRKIIAVRRPRPIHRSHEDPYVALRDAFRAVRRRLQDVERRRQPPPKEHTGPPRGMVCEIDPEAGFGRIETPEGRLLYFHRHSVRDGAFEDLTVGSEVRFDEEAGDQGPQASTVHVLAHPRMH